MEGLRTEGRWSRLHNRIRHALLREPHVVLLDRMAEPAPQPRAERPPLR